MMTAIKITTARPHTPRTHRLRYQGEESLATLKRSVSSMPALRLA
jgi:hypothetical protein